MRKVLLVVFVAFTGSVFALSGIAQRRARARGNRGAPAITAPPSSPQIAHELGTLAWGSTHEQVVEYFRRAIGARYLPLLRNKGQVEQDQLMQERDREIGSIRQSYVQFNGAANQRRWDTSFVGSEYTHNNNESMLVYENPQNNNREFFLFINDRLWKRFQARSVPAGSGMDFAAFVGTIEQLFGPGLHINDPEHAERLMTVAWQDDQTRLHLIDNATFFNAFCLVYEERATLGRLADLRHNAPAKVQNTGSHAVEIGQPAVGNVESDQNTDIVDRITGKIRNTQTAPTGRPGANAGHGNDGNTGRTPTGGPTPTPPAHEGGSGSDNDSLRGL